MLICTATKLPVALWIGGCPCNWKVMGLNPRIVSGIAKV